MSDTPKKARRRSRVSNAEAPPEAPEAQQVTHSLAIVTSPDYIVSVFQSNDLETLKVFNDELRYYIPTNEKIIEALSKDQKIIEATINAFSIVDSADKAFILEKAFYPFFKRNPTGYIDDGLLFQVRDVLENYPFPILRLYEVTPAISSYARDAMCSLGIIDDVIDLFKKTEDIEIKHAVSKVLYNQFRTSDLFQTDHIRRLVPLIISLLALGDDVCKSYILLTLSEINGRDQVFTDVFLELNVHLFINDHINNPELTSSCLTLAGNMSICEPEKMQKIIDCGLIQKVIALANLYENDVYWCLGNCFESSPTTLFPLIMSLLPSTLPSKKPESYLLLASVFLYADSSNVFEVLKLNGTLDKILHGCQDSELDIAAHCLDSIVRILILSHSHKELQEPAKPIKSAENIDMYKKIQSANKGNVLFDLSSLILMHIGF